MFDIAIVNKYMDKQKSYTVYCGRGSALGNPYKMPGRTLEDRAKSCDLYDSTFKERLNQKMKDQLNLIWDIGLEHGVVELQCFCKRHDREIRCHCDTIKRVLVDKQKELESRNME